VTYTGVDMATRIFGLILLLAFTALPVRASSYESAAPIAYMLDMSSGAVLYDKNSEKRIPPASMTKMMTAYVVFDRLGSGELALDDTFTIGAKTAQKWSGRGSTMFLRGGQKVSVENLLHGLITVSGNDAAVALADGIAGSERAFITLMNQKAGEIGLENSRFGTSNGWPDEGRTLVTARDLAVLAQRTMADYPQYYKQFYANKKFTWNNVTQMDRNPLLGKVAGADGLKTGHTNAAGYCLTGSAQQNGRRIVMVVAGLPSYDSRITESVKFMSWGFGAWRSEALFETSAIVGKAQVQLGEQTSVALAAPNNIAATLPKETADTYDLAIRYSGPVKAPVAKGQRVATLVVTMADGSEQTTPLVAANNVAAAGFFGRAWNGLKSLVGAA